MNRTQYKFLVALLFITTLLGGGAALYLYYLPAKDALSYKLDETNVNEEETGAIEVLAAVGKLMVLPEGEEPTIATVSNLEQLASQPFFTNAKVGHKVLIYTEARKVILYDPVLNKIVEVAPLNIDSGL